MASTQAQRAASSLLLGISGAALLLLVQPAPGLPRPAQLATWLQTTPVDQAVLSLATLVGWATVAWLTVIALLAAAAALPGGLGGLSRWTLRLIAPRAIRRAIELALGISLAAGPVFGGVAMAAAPPAAPHNAVLSVPSLDRPLGAIPSLDRPSMAPAMAQAMAHLPTLDRPITVAPRHRAVTVHRGDSLWLIAEHGLGGHASDAQIAAEWPRWYEANRAVIGDNPGLIQPGQHLQPPPP